MKWWKTQFMPLAVVLCAGALFADTGTGIRIGAMNTTPQHDLTTSISASREFGGTAIPNGGQVTFSGGTVNIPVKVTVLCTGRTAVGPSTGHVRITRGSATVVDETFTQAGLASGGRAERFYTVSCPDSTNLIHVESWVDVDNAIREIKENNNWASYRCAVFKQH